MPKALVIEKVEGKPGKVYYPLKIIDQPEPQPKDNEVVVKITSAALNHRDLFIRQGLYGAIGFGVPLLADGCGIVIATGNSPQAKKWQGKRVILNPGHGWESDPEGPESSTGYAILGGTTLNPLGTAVEKLVVDAREVEEAPEHLTSNEAAALPLAGLTAWRAVMTKSGSQMQPGRNILITGIGGGVAVMALLFAVAAGANVYVSSGSAEKISLATKKLGAKGGVNYHEKDWDAKLKAMLPSERPKLDAIIDGAGGDVVQRGVKLLRVRTTTTEKNPNNHLPFPSSFPDTYTNLFHPYNPIGRRHHLPIRNDDLPQTHLEHARGAQKRRTPRLHDGIPTRILRHGQICGGEKSASAGVAGGFLL